MTDGNQFKPGEIDTFGVYPKYPPINPQINAKFTTSRLKRTFTQAFGLEAATGFKLASGRIDGFQVVLPG